MFFLSNSISFIQPAYFPRLTLICNTGIKDPAADIKQISKNKEDHICRTVTNTLSLAN